MTRLEDAMRQMSETVDRTSATVDKTSADMRASSAKADQKWGEMANKMGTLVEDIVAPGLPEVLEKRFGITALEYSARNVRRVHRRDPGRMRELDYIAMAGDLVFVNETKSKLRSQDIAEFLHTLHEIRDYVPDAEGRQVVGCLAAFSAGPSLITAGERQGLLMLGLGTGLLRVLNSPGFEPKRF